MLRPANSPPSFPTLVLLTALATLSLNMFLPSLSNMAADFGVDYALVNLAIAGYLAITAVLQLIIGPLSDRFGRRPVMLGALAIFCVASLGCMLATDIRIFLAFRILQGAIIAGWAVSQAVIRDTFPPQEAASRLGYVAMAMAVAPMLGPILGGGLDELFGWRASFLTFAVIGSIALLLGWVDLGETNKQRSPTFAAQLKLYPELLGSGRFWGYALCTAFSTSAFYAFLSGVPLVAQSVLDLSPARLGVAMGSITAGFFLGSFLAGRYARRYQLTTMMIVGRLVACTGLSVGLALFAVGIVNAASLFGSTIFVGLGNGITMPSSNTGAVSVRPDLAGTAAGLTGAMTVGIGAILTSITGTLLTPEYGHAQLVGVMFACSAIGLFAAIAVRWIEHGRRLDA